MFLVDTNILIYAADLDSEAHTICRDLLIQWRKQSTPWYLTWSVVYEFLRISTHPNVFRKPMPPTSAWRFIEAVLVSPSLGILTETERHQGILGALLQRMPTIRGNLVFDAHNVALMQEHGVRAIYTHDADLRRFPGVEVIDPL